MPKPPPDEQPEQQERETPPLFDKSTRTMSVHALRRAELLGLPVVYRYPLDMGDPGHVARFVADLGDDRLPEDPHGQYYVYDIVSEPGEWVTLVKAEGEVHPSIIDLAARIGGQELAAQFSFRWSLLPRLPRP